jgi:hypothetical protein
MSAQANGQANGPMPFSFLLPTCSVAGRKGFITVADGSGDAGSDRESED